MPREPTYPPGHEPVKPPIPKSRLNGNDLEITNGCAFSIAFIAVVVVVCVTIYNVAYIIYGK